jgi:hypothetical protein
MNTPRTKQPKRFTLQRASPVRTRDGDYGTGLYNEPFITLIGQIATQWPHVEDVMIGILSDLLGNAPIRGRTTGPARQIFRAVLSNRARTKIMASLLEKASINRNKDPFYDDVIEEFDKLNGKRNAYLHGLWYTHGSGKVFLSEQSLDDFHFFDAREVKVGELEDVLDRMGTLLTKVTRRYRWLRSEQPSLPHST